MLTNFQSVGSGSAPSGHSKAAAGDPPAVPNPLPATASGAAPPAVGPLARPTPDTAGAIETEQYAGVTGALTGYGNWHQDGMGSLFGCINAVLNSDSKSYTYTVAVRFNISALGVTAVIHDSGQLYPHQQT